MKKPAEMDTNMNDTTTPPAAPPVISSLLRQTATLLFYITAIVISAILFGLATAAQGQEASTVYRGVPRDPFAKTKTYVRRAPGSKKTIVAGKPAPPAPTIVAAPALQQRIDVYKARKLAAMNAQQPAPKPVTALLLDETQVVGIFRTPRGYAAMIEATPIKLSYVIYPGEVFYDGQLVAVEENKLVFRREKKYSNGKREVAVETKPLRPASAVDNEMIQPKSASSAAPVAAEAAPAATPPSGDNE